MVSIDGLNFYSPTAGALRLNEAAATTGPWAINFNGTSLKTAVDVLGIGSGQVTTDLSTGTGLTRYMSVPFTAAPSVTLVVEYSNSTTGAYDGTSVGGKVYGNGQVAIIDKSGKVLAVQSACAFDAGKTNAVADKQTISATVTDGTTNELFIIYNRSKDATGGLRVWSTKLTK